MKDFKDKNGFITGAASGIGRSFALALAKRGMNLYITDINMESLEKVKLEIEKIGVKVFVCKCDVSRYKDFEKAAKDFYEKLGELDLLINNAGISMGFDLLNIDLKVWKRVMDVNLGSIIHSIKAFLPRMIKRGSGYIANVASGAGILGIAEPIPYIASKFGVVGLSETFFARLKNLGINVSVIVPMWIKTNIIVVDTDKIQYPPKLLEDFGKEKLDKAYSTLMDVIAEGAISPDDAVEFYIEGIQKNQLYIFDNPYYLEALEMKGKDPKQYEDHIVEGFTNRGKAFREHFHKHGIDIEKYM
ncbi:MAG: SDR family oxidoreductase [Candidatus Lokiarchaeota archaeon]|nr:SDR family oxidoreductase [Candidatus Lokiarchaeota archaeon]